MSIVDESQTDVRVLPGHAVIACIRGVIVATAVLALVYSVVMAASKGACPEGYSGDGEYVGARGNPTDAAPQCVNLTLRPSILVYVFLVAALFFALTRVLRRADSETAALRTLDLTMRVMVIAVVGSAIIAHVWFALIPLESWNGYGGVFFYPFPFGSVDMTVTPMQAG